MRRWDCIKLGLMSRALNKEREKLGMPRYFPGEMNVDTWRAAMGIGWMSRERLVQAIPPAYSQFLAERFLEGSK